MDYLKKEQESGNQQTATMETRGQEDRIFSWPKEPMSPDYTSSPLSATLCCHPSFHCLVSSSTRQT